MFADARTIPNETVLDTDVCIAGAGAAGITIARALAGSGLRVIVLESGGLEIEPGTQALYDGEVTGLPYFPLAAARLRYFGGTTNHWGGVCRPFDDADFESRDWVPHSGWPIARADVDPYYLRAVEIVGLGSPEFATEHWADRDRADPFELDEGRVATRVAQIVQREKRSFGERYRAELERAGDVTVVLRANVLEVLTAGEGSRATGVAAGTLEGGNFTVSARAVVLATGGIENPRLLLASRTNRPNGLGNDRDLVGRFFLEHPRFAAGLVLPADRNLPAGFYQAHGVASARIQGYLALPPEVQRREQLTDVQVRLTPVYTEPFRMALDSTDVAALKSLGRLDSFGASLRSVVDDVMSWQDVVIPGTLVPYPEVVGELLDPAGPLADVVPTLLGDVAGFAYRQVTGSAPLESLVLTTRIEPVPNPESRVLLSSERDALGMPKATLDWRLSPDDRRSAARTLELLGAELGRAGLGRLRILLEEDAGGWPDDLKGGWHLMGTTRMSTNASEGVVDRDCQVHGVEGLYVAGSSVFPTAGSGTPTLLLVALALRLADILRWRLR